MPDPLDRRSAWTVLALSLLLLVATAALLVPWAWVPGGSLTPVPAADAFTARQIARAEDYAGTVRVLSWASLAVSLAIAGLLGFTRGGAVLARRVAGRMRWWLAVPVVVLVLLVAGRLVTLPLGLLIRRRALAAGLTDQALSGWLGDRGLSVLVSWAVSTLLVVLVVGTARRFPRRWHLVAGATGVALTFVLSAAYPLLVEPLFNRFTPMPDGALRSSLIEIADAEGVRVDDVLVADASRRTTTLNAYVSGIGGTRRIVVYDNLVNDLPPAEVRSVVAHELGHARAHDVALGTTLGALGVLAATSLLALLLDSRAVQRRAGVRGAGDPAVAALVLALVAYGTVLSGPAQNTVSRAIEARADRAALEFTDDPAAFERLQRQLALRSLADPTPPAWSQFWFGTHPTVLQRLGLPASLRRAEG